MKPVRVCQCCHSVLKGDTNEPTLRKWKAPEAATHGQCDICSAAIERVGYDEYLKATEGLREGKK